MGKMVKNAVIGALVVFAVVATGGAALSIAGFVFSGKHGNGRHCGFNWQAQRTSG